jgi:hypothetical protein
MNTDARLKTSYNTLTGTNRKAGISSKARANHLNQHAIYGGVIKREDGLAHDLTVQEHNGYHSVLRKFYIPYRGKPKLPTNKQYEAASKNALIKGAGLSKQRAAQFTLMARKQRLKYKLKQNDPIPRLPGS